MVACGFAWLLSLALTFTFVWADWVEPAQRLEVWLLLIVAWMASIALSFRQLLGFDSGQAAKTVEDLFREAQCEYLHGNWIKAEHLLTRLIGRNKNDANAQIMWAGLLRRTGRVAEAYECLRQLERRDASHTWHGEIQRERQLLDDLR
jgi:uncharacterized protein HemY